MLARRSYGCRFVLAILLTSVFFADLVFLNVSLFCTIRTGSVSSYVLKFLIEMNFVLGICDLGENN